MDFGKTKPNALIISVLQNLNIENYDLYKSFVEEGDGNKSVNSHLVPLHHTVNTIIAPLNTYQFYHLPTPHLRYLSDDKETACKCAVPTLIYNK